MILAEQLQGVNNCTRICAVVIAVMAKNLIVKISKTYQKTITALLHHFQKYCSNRFIFIFNQLQITALLHPTM